MNGENESPVYTWLKEQLPDEEVHDVKAKAAMAMIKTSAITVMVPQMPVFLKNIATRSRIISMPLFSVSVRFVRRVAERVVFFFFVVIVRKFVGQAVVAGRPV